MVALIGKNVAQISNGISNPVIAGIIYWLIRTLVCGGCLVGVGILLAFIGIKIAGIYKKYCWDMIIITNHVLYCEYTSTGENLPFLEEEYGVATENGGFQMNGRWSDNPMVL